MNGIVIESVAKALLVNKQGKALVLTLSEHRLNPARSFTPDLPGGLVDPGESEHEAVVREIHEEIGIIIDKTQLTMAYSGTQFSSKDNKSVTKHLFIVEGIDEAELTLSWEHSAYKWVGFEELRATQFGSFYSAAIDYCFNNKLLNAEIVTKP